MRSMLMGCAALAAVVAAAHATPAAAQSGGFVSGGSNAALNQFERGRGGSIDRERRDPDRDRDNRRRGRGDSFVWFGDREYQGDTAWRSDSFNDWWHDRPDRAYPRWMTTNQNCARTWWSGTGWRC